MLKTLHCNMLDLQSPNSLVSAREPPVTRTKLHAMTLVEDLSERYLWVDSLCIVQDDIDSLTAHIRHMGSMYRAETSTIVVAHDQDANDGITSEGNLKTQNDSVCINIDPT